MADPSPDVPLTSAPTDGLSFGHFIVPRHADGSLWKLGEGNMGVTYRAFDTSLRVEVALKVINAARVNEDDARRRFQREARAAARIRHPNIANVLYLGEEGGEFFYAMEFVAGPSLDMLLRETGGPLPPAVAVALAAQVASALNAAHRREVVHRDLKPSNLMLLEGTHIDQEDARTRAAGQRQIKVIDFGLARSFNAERQDESLVTQNVTGFIGTPVYSSPEQAAGEGDIDGRSDLYSLGIVLWQMLAGQPPFTGRVVEVVRKHLFTPPPMEQLPAGLPEYLRQVISGLLVKEPAQRWPQTASDLRDALDASLHDLENMAFPPLGAQAEQPDSTAAPLAVIQTIPTADNAPRGPVNAPPPRARVGRGWLVGGGLLLLVAAVCAGGWWLTAGRSPRLPTQAAAVPTPGKHPSAPVAVPSPPPPAPVQPQPGGNLEEALDQARALRQRGDMRGALTRLREVLVANPDNAPAIAEMALTYEAMQQNDHASEQWQRLYNMGQAVGALYYLADNRLHNASSPTPASPGPTTSPPVVSGNGTHAERGFTRVLMIGDSMSIGGFGEGMAEWLVSKFGRGTVAMYAACDASPQNWLRDEPDHQTQCGYREITPRTNILYDRIGTRRPAPAIIPKVEDLVSILHPRTVIVQLGDAWMESMGKHGDATKYGEALYRFVNAIRIEPGTVRQIIWITPPDSSHYSREVQQIVHDLIIAGGRKYGFAVVDSSRLTHYTPGRSGSDGIRYKDEEGRQWATDVLREIAPVLQ